MQLTLHRDIEFAARDRKVNSFIIFLVILFAVVITIFGFLYLKEYFNNPQSYTSYYSNHTFSFKNAVVHGPPVVYENANSCAFSLLFMWLIVSAVVSTMQKSSKSLDSKLIIADGYIQYLVGKNRTEKIFFTDIKEILTERNSNGRLCCIRIRTNKERPCDIFGFTNMEDLFYNLKKQVSNDVKINNSIVKREK